MRFLIVVAAVLAIAGNSHGVECGDALKEVNRARMKRGLPPFKADAKLARAAMAAAKYRAKHLVAGHTSDDFQYLPKGARAAAAGCAAWARGEGWGSCCTYDGWHFAGAAWAFGHDGNRYMHLFVR